MKIFVNKEKARWILDDIWEDYKRFSKHQVVGINDCPDICWFLNPWGLKDQYSRIPLKSYISVHHIDETKIKEWDFRLINQCAEACIVPNKHTEITMRKYIEVPVYRVPYWILEKRMIPKKTIEKKDDVVRIGSFQKDTEKDGISPKLSKGPDIFIDVINKIYKNTNIKVILSGYNRGYIINNLSRLKIPYEYQERCKDLNALYDIIDWYFVTSRCEGGPQAVLEAPYKKVKILSTDVGMASEVLHKDCICKNSEDFVDKFNKNVDQIEYNYQNIFDNYIPQKIVPLLDDIFEKGGK